MRGGDVLLAVRNDVQCEFIECKYLDINFPLIDTLMCKRSCYFITIFIIVVSIPPAMDADSMKSFLGAFEQLDYLQDTPVIILSEFNIPSVVDPNTHAANYPFLNFFEL